MSSGRFRSSGVEEVRLAANVIGPRYYDHFAQPLLDAVTPGSGEVVLNIKCHTGSLARKIHAQLGGGRVVAIDNDDGLIEYARRVAHQEPRVFFKREADPTSLSFGTEAFDLAVGVIADTPLVSLSGLLTELRRVLCLRRGRALLSVSASDSVQPLLEMLDEVARSEGDAELRTRLRRRKTTLSEWTEGARSAGFRTVRSRPETFRLSYRSAREIPSDPLARATFLPKLLKLASPEEAIGEERVRAAAERLAVYTGGGPVALPVQMHVLSLS